MPLDFIDRLIPTFSNASIEERRRARVAVVSLIIFAAAIAFNAVFSALAGRTLNSVIGWGLAAGCLALLRGLKRERLQAVSIALVLLQVFGATVSALATDGVANLMTPWLVVPPLFAQLQLGRRAAWLTTGALWALTAVVFLLEQSGVFVPPSGPLLTQLEAHRVFTYALATAVVLLLTQTVEAEGLRTRALLEADAQRERDRVRQAQLWKLVAGMAHEVNNPLAALSLNLQYVSSIVDRCGKCMPDVQLALNETTAGSDRVATLINDLRLVTTLNDAVAERVPLHEVAQRVAAGSSQNVRVETEPTFVHGSSAAIERTLSELVRNLCWSIHDFSAELLLSVRREQSNAVVQLRDRCAHRQPCEFPVAEFLALHTGGALTTEDTPDGHCVSLRLPALV